MKKNTITKTNHNTLMPIKTGGLNPRIGSTLAVTTPRVTFTRCVSGNTDRAMPCAAAGSDVSGKKVPHKKNMGVRNRKLG